MAAVKKRNLAEAEENANSDVEELPPLHLSEGSDDESDAEPSDADSIPSLDGFDSSDIDELSSEDDLDENALKSESDDDRELSGKTEIGADGLPREILPEIDPHYSSDDSDREDENTVGNIPIAAYDKYPHIGYNIDGKRIMRPATQSAIDSLLETIDLPKGWTGLIDKNTGRNLNLSKEEMDLIDRVQKGMLPDDSINPFEDQLEWFSNEKEDMPLSATNEPKRRFVPSKHEAKTVMKMVRAIREGKLVLKDYDRERELAAENFDDDQMMTLNRKLYDVWEKEEHVVNRMHLQAPKLAPPTHDESYNPPAEYLMTEEEKAKWEAAAPEDRETNYVPQKFSALRRVPGYANGIRERFERCLDLYLAPRMRNKRTNVDPESLIPDLPSPDELRPFPIKCSTVYRGHEGQVRTLGVDPTGNYLATGGEDGSVRVWDVITGRELWRLDVLKADTYTADEDSFGVHPDDRIDDLQWHPKLLMLSVVAGDNIYLIVPQLMQDLDTENPAFEALDRGWAFSAKGNVPTMDRAASENKNDADEESSEEDDDNEVSKRKQKQYSEWTKPPQKLVQGGCSIVIRSTKRIKKIDWHSRGDYFVTTQPDASNASVLVHQLSKHVTQSPFKRAKGLVQDAKFHPFRPHLYVASQRYVRIYNLAAQTMVKRLQPGVKWLSTFDIHPQGENVVTASFDRRVTWHDLELSTRPFKTLRYHDRAVRDTKYHPKLPLFCSASDDGTINVLHCTVYDDTMKNPLLVPLKILKGHKVTKSLGVLQVAWHPREAWLFSAGGDGTARLWTT